MPATNLIRLFRPPLHKKAKGARTREAGNGFHCTLCLHGDASELHPVLGLGIGSLINVRTAQASKLRSPEPACPRRFDSAQTGGGTEAGGGVRAEVDHRRTRSGALEEGRERRTEVRRPEKRPGRRWNLSEIEGTRLG
jgi:hypothetical protein